MTETPREAFPDLKEINRLLDRLPTKADLMWIGGAFYFAAICIIVRFIA